MSTRERLQRIEAKVRQMEQALGLDNPQVRLASSGSLHSAPCMLLIFVQALPVHTRRCVCSDESAQKEQLSVGTLSILRRD